MHPCFRGGQLEPQWGPLQINIFIIRACFCMPAKLQKLVGNYCKLWSKTTGWKEVLLLSDAQTHQVSVK